MANIIVQFQGETRREAIVNHFSLDIVEEEKVFEYIEAMGYTENDEDEIIIAIVKKFIGQF